MLGLLKLVLFLGSQHYHVIFVLTHMLYKTLQVVVTYLELNEDDNEVLKISE